MSKIITIKLTKASPSAGPFNIYDQRGDIIATDVSLADLIEGVSYDVSSGVIAVTVTSTGKCKVSKTINVGTVTPLQLINLEFERVYSACMWRHLTTINTFNHYYGNTEPYVIEYPFAYLYQDELMQNVKDYTKAYVYSPDGTGVFAYPNKIEVDDQWFNKSVVYNGQQCSGILKLVPKPKHNLKAYLEYPKFETDGKQILFTKSDNLYQYNTFWNVVKDKTKQIFITSCESLSIDKVVNQSNMDYSYRSFRKDTIRAKEAKVRHILDDKYQVHLVSQFIVAPAQISYK